MLRTQAVITVWAFKIQVCFDTAASKSGRNYGHGEKQQSRLRQLKRSEGVCSVRAKRVAERGLALLRLLARSRADGHRLCNLSIFGHLSTRTWSLDSGSDPQTLMLPRLQYATPGGGPRVWVLYLPKKMMLLL